MLKKVAFTMYPVQDAERARTFYEETLGLTRGKYSPNGIWTEYDLPGGGCLALFATEEVKPSGDSSGSVAFEVANLNAQTRRLENENLRFESLRSTSYRTRMAPRVQRFRERLVCHLSYKMSLEFLAPKSLGLP